MGLRKLAPLGGGRGVRSPVKVWGVCAVILPARFGLALPSLSGRTGADPLNKSSQILHLATDACPHPINVSSLFRFFKNKSSNLKGSTETSLGWYGRGM